jgi:hypothetical protein
MRADNTNGKRGTGKRDIVDIGSNNRLPGTAGPFPQQDSFLETGHGSEIHGEEREFEQDVPSPLFLHLPESDQSKHLHLYGVAEQDMGNSSSSPLTRTSFGCRRSFGW